MTYDVSSLSREELIDIIHQTAKKLKIKLQVLTPESNNKEAHELYEQYILFINAVQLAFTNDEFYRLDTDGLQKMAVLSLKVSKAYTLLVFTPEDQKKYNEAIEKFKKVVYAKAKDRLNKNRKELEAYKETLLNEVGNKEGINLKPVYNYYDLCSEYDANRKKILDFEYKGNFDDNRKCEEIKEKRERNLTILAEKANLVRTFPLVNSLQSYNSKTIETGINKLCKKIAKAQDKVEKLLDKQKYPIWELTPIVSEVLASKDFCDEDTQAFILDWISTQKGVDELFDVFKNAIPISLSILCFFVSGGISLIVQLLNAAAGTAAAIDDIAEANNIRNMAYSQYHVSDEAKRIIDDADLSAVERNYAMAIFSGAFVVADFVDCIKVAKKLGIGDKVTKLFSKGKATKAEIEGLEEALLGVKKGNKGIMEINPSILNNVCENFPKAFSSKILSLNNASEIIKILDNKIEYLKYLNENTLIKIANSSDVKSALEKMIKQNEEIVRIGNEKALEVIATQSIRDQGPCLSTIYDQDLQQYFFGQNFKNTPTGHNKYEYWIHNDANAIIKKRFLSYDDSINKGLIVLSTGADKRLAEHSEIRALNDLLEARTTAGLPINDEIIQNVYIYNVDLTATRKTNCIITKPRCENCTALTDGANTILNK